MFVPMMFTRSVKGQMNEMACKTLLSICLTCVILKALPAFSIVRKQTNNINDKTLN